MENEKGTRPNLNEHTLINLKETQLEQAHTHQP